MSGKQNVHRRLNPLTGEWVLVSPQRAERPWQGETGSGTVQQKPAYDPGCYLCPGNRRAHGETNPAYTGTFEFDNDFPALLAEAAPSAAGEHDLLRAENERGICRVMCFSPRHDLTLAGMEVPDITAVVASWASQYTELGSLPFINHVQIFENRGEIMGASNPHPHCQIWANETIPDLARREMASQQEYAERKKSCLLCDYAALESGGERLVCENEAFLAVTPFWAVWPFETLVLGKRHTTGLDQLAPAERTALADILKQLTSCYDRVFDSPFPYTMGFHQRPTDGSPHDSFHMHAHYYPPLLRSATVRKYMVGYELLAGPQRDITAEQAAARLRAACAI